MTVIERRRLNPFSDMLSWLDEADFGLLSSSPQIRVEDFVEDGSYVVRADIPGIDPDKDLHVSVEHGHLVVQGERHEETHDRYRREVRYGSFTRSFPVPAGVEAADIQAQYVDGVLEVRIPVGKPETPPQTITVSRPEG